MWGEITYPLPNFNGATVEVWNRLVILSHTLKGMWLPIHVGKRGPWSYIFFHIDTPVEANRLAGIVILNFASITWADFRIFAFSLIVETYST